MFNIDQAIQTFQSAITAAESQRDLEPLLKLFSGNAEIGSVGLLKTCSGTASARWFWQEYLRMFRQVKTTFIHVHGAGHLATLEWHSTGQLASGESISYQGVTILEFDGEVICRLRTYYDSAAFIPDYIKLLGRKDAPFAEPLLLHTGKPSC